MKIPSYSKVYNLGHKEILEIFNDEVTIEEKLDGSQFSFGRYNGKFLCRSRGQQIDIECPDKMFIQGIAVAKVLDLKDGYTYRCEYFQKPKHNTLAYDRIPNKHLMIFDIDAGDQCYLSYEDKKKECERLGLEITPILGKRKIDSFEQLKEYLEKVSILGGQKIEGVVVKNYNKFTSDKKTMMGKYVSEAFREVHSKDWKSRNKTGKDIIRDIVATYRTNARWDKSIQHLKENGLLSDTPKDIGALIREIMDDTKKECREEISYILFEHHWKTICKGITTGFPEYYKELLAKKNFEVKQ